MPYILCNSNSERLSVNQSVEGVEFYWRNDKTGELDRAVVTPRQFNEFFRKIRRGNQFANIIEPITGGPFRLSEVYWDSVNGKIYRNPDNATIIENHLEMKVSLQIKRQRILMWRVTWACLCNSVYYIQDRRRAKRKKATRRRLAGAKTRARRRK